MKKTLVDDIIDGLKFAYEHDATFDTSADSIQSAILLLRENQQHIDFLKTLLIPRVMTQTEVFMEHNSLYEGCVWLETKGGALAPVFLDCMINGEMRVFSPYILPIDCNGTYITWWNLADYYISWRCWTSRPEDKEREAEKWHE